MGLLISLVFQLKSQAWLLYQYPWLGTLNLEMKSPSEKEGYV